MPPDFEEVFHSNHDSVVREVARIVGIDAAKDVTADAFAELHRRWDHVSGFDKPGAWVRRVALRRALRELKSKRRRESFLVDAPAVTPFDTFLADTITLRDAINTLPRKQRDAIVLRYFLQETDSSIARTIGCSESTVRVHLARGRATLRTTLSEGENLCVTIHRLDPVTRPASQNDQR